MGMGKDHVVSKPFFRQQLIPQFPDACTCIDDDDLIVMGPDFYTGRISPIFYIFLSRYRNGASRSPTSNDHSLFFPLPICR
jgi:hypothetical protein